MNFRHVCRVYSDTSNRRSAPTRFLPLVAFVASALLCAQPELCPAETAKPGTVASVKSTALFQRVVVIGASASAGFTMSEPLGGTNTLKLGLGRYLDAAIRSPHEPIQNFASTMFFMQPETQARYQIDRALKAAPTFVAAPDFLFWFCYGAGTNLEHRLSRFEFGLKLLEKVPCPVVVGDIPDCSAAVNGILDPEEIPSREAIFAANERLKQWVATHPKVKIAPVAAFVEKSMARQPIAIRGEPISASDSRRLIQGDRVHPTTLGAAVLALMLLEAAESKSAATSDDILWNYKDVLRLGLNSSSSVSTNQIKTAPTPTKENVSGATVPASGGRM